jgi:8-oxo-dGTP pyrophosphatase MutT (NUDIX family)
MNGSSTISFPFENALFNFRVAGIAVCDGKILLHKTADDNFWSLPGGRVEMFEFSKETLLREMVEETGREVEVGALAWVAENFFEYNGLKYHEIGFYYRMNFINPVDQDDFVVKDGNSELLFRWHDLAQIDSLRIYPDFIDSGLLDKTDGISHFLRGLKDLHLPQPILS